MNKISPTSDGGGWTALTVPNANNTSASALRATRYGKLVLGSAWNDPTTPRGVAMYLFEVKKSDESKYPYDYYKLIATIPADQAFRPVADGGCLLVK